MSELVYFWIFEVFVPKGQMGFNFGIFPEFGVFTSFCVPPCFLRFSWHELGRELRQSVWMSVGPLLHLVCIGTRVSIHFVFSSSPLFDLRDGGAPHTSASVG